MVKVMDLVSIETKENNSTSSVAPKWLAELDYVERDEYEKSIVSYLLDDSIIGPFITGFHGVGKTSIAKKITSKCRHYFENIFYITISDVFTGENEESDSVEELIIYILREMSNYSSYKFSMKGKMEKHRAEEEFISFIKTRHTLIVIDDFNLPICQKLLLWLPQHSIKTKFLFISNERLIVDKQFDSERIQDSIDFFSIYPEVEIRDFTRSQARDYIDKRLNRLSYLPDDRKTNVIDTILGQKIRHPLELALLLSCIIDSDDLDNALHERITDFVYGDTGANQIVRNIVNEDWSRLEMESKVLLYFISFFNTGANLRYLFEQSDSLSKLKDSVQSLIRFNLIIEVDKGVYTLNALTKKALEKLMKKEDSAEKYSSHCKLARDLWVDICCKIVSEVGDCYNQYWLLEKIDKAGGIEFVKGVMKYCVSVEKYLIADTIGINSSYYCYVRGDGSILSNSIEMLRYECAKKLDNKGEMSNALAAQLNILSKRRRMEDAKKVFDLINEINYTPITINDEVRLNHAIALFYLASNDYDNAYLIWHDLYLNRRNLRAKDVGTVSRWLCKCMREMHKKNDEILKILNGTLDMAKAHNATRDIVQCTIDIFDIMFTSNCLTDSVKNDFLCLEDELEIIRDPSFYADYYFQKYCYHISRDESDVACDCLHLAYKYYNKLFDVTMCNRVKSLLSQISS